MDLHTELLQRMASISPGVRFHLSGQIWLEHIDEDEVTPSNLVSECFSLMVDEAYEIGLEFFCTRADLCDSLYHLDKVLLAFEIFFPTPLYTSLTQDAGFRNRLLTAVKDGAVDPGISPAVDVLYYLAMEHPTAMGVFQDMWMFLQDKLVSTTTFNTYVLSILETDNTSFQAPIDEADVTAYIEHLKDVSLAMTRAIDHLLNKRPALFEDAAQVQYNRVAVYRYTATDAQFADEYVWLYKTTTASLLPTPTEQALAARFTQQFCSTVPFYSEFYRLQNLPLTCDDIISLILGCLIDTKTKASFASEVDSLKILYAELQTTLTTDANTMSQEIALILMERFYP